nr:MAG TPA: TM helix protein [Bacteriophage sp.]
MSTIINFAVAVLASVTATLISKWISKHFDK